MRERAIPPSNARPSGGRHPEGIADQLHLHPIARSKPERLKQLLRNVDLAFLRKTGLMDARLHSNLIKFRAHNYVRVSATNCRVTLEFLLSTLKTRCSMGGKTAGLLRRGT